MNCDATGRLRVKVGRWALSIGLFFLLWEIIGRSEMFLSIVPASEAIPELFALFGEGDILVAAKSTLTLAATGFLIGGVLGVAVGTWIATVQASGRCARPARERLVLGPVRDLHPRISIYLGLEFTAKVFLVILFNIFVIIINTATGIREVPSGAREMARAFGIDRCGMYRKVVFPWASPHIITGLRTRRRPVRPGGDPRRPFPPGPGARSLHRGRAGEVRHPSSARDGLLRHGPRRGCHGDRTAHRVEAARLEASLTRREREQRGGGRGAEKAIVRCR